MPSSAFLLRVLLALALGMQGLPTAFAMHGDANPVPAAMTDGGGCHEHGAPASDDAPPAPMTGDCCDDGDCACACAVAPMLSTLVTAEPVREAPAATTFTEPAAGHRAPPAVHRLRPPIARA